MRNHRQPGRSLLSFQRTPIFVICRLVYEGMYVRTFLPSSLSTCVDLDVTGKYVGFPFRDNSKNVFRTFAYLVPSYGIQDIHNPKDGESIYLLLSRREA